MAVSTLVATAGASNANTYCDLATAEQYHADRTAAGTTWSAASTDQKNAALLWATKLLDALYEWNGWVASYTQALLWPRIGLAYRRGDTVPSDVVPVEIQQATAEFARQLIAEDRAADNDIETKGLTSLKAGPVAMTFKDSVVAKVVPDAVWTLIPADWGHVRSRTPAFSEVVRV